MPILLSKCRFNNSNRNRRINLASHPLMSDTHSKYYPYFDYLRIVLAISVMLYHDQVLTWTYTGTFAVDVFFALSGWLIGGILLRSEATIIPKFFFNRAARIWIPYGIALCLIIIASLLKDPIDAKWFEFIIYKITWVYNIFGTPQLADCVRCMPLDGTANHFWSINAEEQFYLLAPLIILIIPFGRSIFLWVLISIGLWLSNIYAPIAFGVLAATINIHYPNFYLSRAARTIFIILMVVSGYGLIVNWTYYLTAPFCAVTIVLLLSKNGKPSAIGKVIGGISYPLYLNHWIGVFFFNLVLDPFGLRDSPTRQILAAILNIAIAFALYWVVDRNVLNARERLYTPFKGKLLTVLAYGTILIGLLYGFTLTNG